MTEHFNVLENLPFYKELREESRALLSRGAILTNCDASEVILQPGKKISGAYIVLGGRLRVYSIFPDGNEATLYNINPGETCILALNCLFNDLLYPAWVEAESYTQVAVIPGRIYRLLFKDEPSVQDLTVRSQSTLVFRLMAELGRVNGQSIRQRLANLLLTRASSEGKVRATQQQLAQHLGTRREVVARILLDFANNGLLISGRGNLTLLDTNSLKEIFTPSVENHAEGS